MTGVHVGQCKPPVHRRPASDGGRVGLEFRWENRDSSRTFVRAEKRSPFPAREPHHVAGARAVRGNAARVAKPLFDERLLPERGTDHHVAVGLLNGDFGMGQQTELPPQTSASSTVTSVWGSRPNFRLRRRPPQR